MAKTQIKSTARDIFAAAKRTEPDWRLLTYASDARNLRTSGWYGTVVVFYLAWYRSTLPGERGTRDQSYELEREGWGRTTHAQCSYRSTMRPYVGANHECCPRLALSGFPDDDESYFDSGTDADFTPIRNRYIVQLPRSHKSTVLYSLLEVSRIRYTYFLL